MIKLIFEYSEGGEFTGSCTHTIPFCYSSKQNAEADFFQMWYSAMEKYVDHMSGKDVNYNAGSIHFFKDCEMYLSLFYWYDSRIDSRHSRKTKYPTRLEYKMENFVYSPPKIYTLEEWFENTQEIPITH